MGLCGCGWSAARTKRCWKGTKGPVWTLVFGIDQDILASAGGALADETSTPDIWLWDVETGEQADTLTLDTIPAGAAARSLILSPDGTVIALGTMEGAISTIRLLGVVP